MTVVEHERVEELTTPREVTEADVLERAADLLEEFGWCQRAPARDATGKEVSVISRDAESFCLLGATWRAGLDLGHGSFVSPVSDCWASFPLGEASEWLLARSLHLTYCWNDVEGRTKEEVVAALRTAAEKARES